jgi:PAS domain S-box-containing protein
MWNERMIPQQETPTGEGGCAQGPGEAETRLEHAPVPERPEGPDIETEFLQGLLQISPLPAFILDWKLRIVFQNKAFRRLTGYRTEDMARDRLTFRVHPADRDEAESSILMALVGRTARCHCRVQGWNGALHSLDLTFSPVVWKGRQLVLCSGIKGIGDERELLRA